MLMPLGDSVNLDLFYYIINDITQICDFVTFYNITKLYTMCCYHYFIINYLYYIQIHNIFLYSTHLFIIHIVTKKKKSKTIILYFIHIFLYMKLFSIYMNK